MRQRTNIRAVSAAPNTIRPVQDSEVAIVAALEERAFSDTLLSVLGHGLILDYYRWQMYHSPVSILLGSWCGETMTGFCFGGDLKVSLRKFYAEHTSKVAKCFATRPWIVFSPVVWNHTLEAIQRRTRLMRIPAVPLSPVPAAPPLPAHGSFCIGRLAVDPYYRRHGIARLLLAEMEKQAIARGFRSLHLYVSIHNTAAITLYSSLGWQSVAETSQGLTMAKVVQC